MNVQRNLIGKPTLYKFELGHNAMDTTKNILEVKCEGGLQDSRQSGKVR